MRRDFIALALAALIAAPPAQALLLEQSLGPGANDGLITYDTKARIEWLDLTATLGLSYNEILGTPYVVDQGFRFATATELRTLYLAAGIDVVPTGYRAEYFAGVQQLLGLLGCTVFCEPTYTIDAGQGWFDYGGPTLTGYSFFQLGVVDGSSPPYVFGGSVSLWDDPFAPKDLPADAFLRRQTGGFLIRYHGVPEPGTFALVGLGLVGLILTHRRMK
jgi:hypothetical protein